MSVLIVGSKMEIREILSNIIRLKKLSLKINNLLELDIKFMIMKKYWKTDTKINLNIAVFISINLIK